ncbi:MAG: hypothetical protein Q8L29_00310 [archaeon]|nr:hypothetical protein [archaeon]
MNNKLILSILFTFFFLSFASAQLTFTPNDKFAGTYHIESITGNESILYDVFLSNGILTILPKDKIGITKEECTIDVKGKEICKSITYLVPNILPFSTSSGTKIVLPKISDKWIYTLPKIFYSWIKLGFESITLTGDTTYNSTNTNITAETGFTHLNISDSSLLYYNPMNAPLRRSGNYDVSYDYTDN